MDVKQAAWEEEKQDQILQQVIAEKQVRQTRIRRALFSFVGTAVGLLAVLILSVQSRPEPALMSTPYDPTIARYEQRFAATQDPRDRALADAAIERAKRHTRRNAMKTNPVVFLLIVLILGVGVLGAASMFIYNGVAKADERCDRQWAQIQAQLQRRLDMIPALVETVQAYAKHEETTLIAVTQARTRAQSSLQAAGTGKEGAAIQQMDQDQRALGDSLQRLLVSVEKYPDLKANESFRTLQDQLEGTENRIATERMRYNDVVGTFNEKLRLFPSNIIGSAFGFQSRQYFEAKLDAAEPPALGFKK